jgi:Raf kinase inhibitor-like YbhB/YbcL family protein
VPPTPSTVRAAQAAAALAALAALFAAGCGGGERVRPIASLAPFALRLSSPDFADGARLPRRVTCDGDSASPALRWSRPPPRTRELALVVDDPDAPRGTFAHWLVYGLPRSDRGLPAGTKPATLRLGKTSSGKVGYEPPCPPKGDDAHRYVFTLYALRAPLGLPYGAEAKRVRDAIARRAIARGRLTGRYSR